MQIQPKSCTLSAELAEAPKRTDVHIMVDAQAIDFLRGLVGKRGVGEKISELIVEFQQRRQAEQRNRRRMAAVSKLNNDELSTWLYG